MWEMGIKVKGKCKNDGDHNSCTVEECEGAYQHKESMQVVQAHANQGEKYLYCRLLKTNPRLGLLYLKKLSGCFGNSTSSHYISMETLWNVTILNVLERPESKLSGDI